jgi:hypothetical protein
MNLYEIIIDRSDHEKDIYVKKVTKELKGMGLSVIQTSVLTALIAEARRQGMLEHAI